MNKLAKKEIRQSIEDAIRQTLIKFEISMPSKKTQKLLENSSRKIAEQLKDELKRKFKKTSKSVKKEKSPKAEKKRSLTQNVA